MALTVTVHLPPALEGKVRASTLNLDETLKESLLVALYRHGEISHHALAQTLGLDRFQTEAVLKRHNVVEDLASPDEYLDDARALRDLLPSSP